MTIERLVPGTRVWIQLAEWDAQGPSPDPLAYRPGALP